MSMHVSTLKKTAVAALAASVLATGVTAFTSTSAEAQWRPRYGYKPYRPARGAAVAAGIIGGIAAGALIAGAANPGYAAPAYGHPGYAGPAYGYPSYAAPAYSYPSYAAPVYSAPSYYQPTYGYAHQPTCYVRRVRQVVDYDTVVIRRVRVCQ